jgi:hypothetical protein
MAWSKMVNMELSDDEKFDAMIGMPCISNGPDYPYGLKICLTEKELEKLGLKPDADIGEVIDLRAFAVVTSVSTERRDGKDTARVELQIERLAIENESTESTEPGDDD